MAASSSYVYLKCIAEPSGKLRVRVVTRGYNPRANVQFPRGIRCAGKYYRLPQENLGFFDRGSKFYYRVRGKGGKAKIVVLDEYDGEHARLQYRSNAPHKVDHIWGEDGDDCLICYESQADVVFLPCGHFCTCERCARPLNRCPMCRTELTGKPGRAQVEAV